MSSFPLHPSLDSCESCGQVKRLCRKYKVSPTSLYPRRMNGMTNEERAHYCQPRQQPKSSVRATDRKIWKQLLGE